MTSQRRPASRLGSQRVVRAASAQTSTMLVRFTRCDRGPVAVRLFGQHARPQDAPDSLVIWIGALPGDEAALE